MILVDDISTAVALGYEEIARLQLDIAKRSRVSGDITIYNKKQMTSTKLYAYMSAISHIEFNHTIKDNAVIERLYNKIKALTKDLRQWD